MRMYLFQCYITLSLNTLSQNYIIMNVLPKQFSSLLYCGLWEEDALKFSLKKKLYRAITILLIFYFCLGAIISFFITYESFENITAIYDPLINIVFTFKVMNFLLKENNVREILTNFENNSFKSKSPEETAILNIYIKKSQDIFVYLMGMLQLCSLSIALNPLLQRKEETQLPTNLYTPYDTSQSTSFVITYIFQCLLTSFSIFVNITLDTTVYGLMLITIGQFELCAHRIENFSKNNKAISAEIIKECIEHHVRILNLVKQIESFFMIVVLPFFVSSLFILCTIIVQIKKVIEQKKNMYYSLNLKKILLNIFLFTRKKIYLLDNGGKSSH